MQVNGKELAVEVTGDGPAVVLVHGLGGTSNFYQPQVAALAERFTVVRPDMEGSGRSPVAGTLSIEGFANDLAALIETLDAGPARVVGHSMGTITVRSLAARRPELVSHLALLGAVPAPLPEAGQQGQHDRAAKVRAEGMAAVADAVMTNATAEATRRDHPADRGVRPRAGAAPGPGGLRPLLRGPGRRQRPRTGRPGPAPAAAHRRGRRRRGARRSRTALADAHGSAVLEIFARTAGTGPRSRSPHEVTEHLLKFFSDLILLQPPSTTRSRHEQGPVPQRLDPRLHGRRPVPRRRARRGRPHRGRRHRRGGPRRCTPRSSRAAGAR